jgi:hypothetical protein
MQGNAIAMAEFDSADPRLRDVDSGGELPLRQSEPKAAGFHGATEVDRDDAGEAIGFTERFRRSPASR